MKKYKIQSLVTSIALSFLLLMACTDLDTPVVSELTPDIFPITEDDFVVIEGPIFTNLSQYYMQGIWFCQECTGDGMVLTANGGNWYDAGRYYNHHHHTWTADQRFIREAWQCCYSGISKCNSLLPLFEAQQESRYPNLIVGIFSQPAKI